MNTFTKTWIAITFIGAALAFTGNLQAQQPTEEQVRINASLVTMQQQRNNANDQVALAAGQIAVLEKQLKEAQARIAEYEKAKNSPDKPTGKEDHSKPHPAP